MTPRITPYTAGGSIAERIDEGAEMTTPVPAATPLTGTIRNARWCDDDYRSPNICGDIYGNPRFGDGTFVWTSAVLEDLGGDLFRTRSGSIYRAEWADASQPGRPAGLSAPASAEPREISHDEIFLMSKWAAHQGGSWKPEDPNSDLVRRLVDGKFVRRLWDSDAPRDGFGVPSTLDGSYLGWTDAGRRLMEVLLAPRPARPDAGEAVAFTPAQIEATFLPWAQDRIPGGLGDVSLRAFLAAQWWNEFSAALNAHPPAASAETAPWEPIETSPIDGSRIWVSDGERVWQTIAWRDGTLRRGSAASCKFWCPDIYTPKPPTQAALAAQEVQS